MAPAKSGRTLSQKVLTTTRSTILTRNKSKALITGANVIAAQPRVKRKADASPQKDLSTKRSALGDVTNNKKTIDPKLKVLAKANTNINPAKKITVQVKHLPSVKTAVKPKQNENLLPPVAPNQRLQTRATLRTCDGNSTAQKPKEPVKAKSRLSNEFEKTEDSLYSTALEDV